MFTYVRLWIISANTPNLANFCLLKAVNLIRQNIRGEIDIDVFVVNTSTDTVPVLEHRKIL